MLKGSINHISVTMSDLSQAMELFGPVHSFLGYTLGRPLENPSTGTRLTMNLRPASLAPDGARHDEPGWLGPGVFEVRYGTRFSDPSPSPGATRG